MAPDKAVALYLRLAMRVGLMTTGDIERWADGVVARDPVVTYPVTELCMARSLPRAAVDELLGEVAGHVDRFLPARMLMALVRRLRCRGDLTGPEAARIAYAAAQLGELPEEEANHASGIDDFYSLALSGTYGTVANADRELDEYLDRFRAYEDLLPGGT